MKFFTFENVTLLIKTDLKMYHFSFENSMLMKKKRKKIIMLDWKMSSVEVIFFLSTNIILDFNAYPPALLSLDAKVGKGKYYTPELRPT